MQKIKVILVDDHQIVRDGLKTLLADEPDLEVISEASNGLEAIEKVQACKPDLAIVDLSMPDMDGLELIGLLSEKFPDCKTVVLSRHQEIAYILRAINLGVGGYLIKQISIGELVRAIRSVIGGDVYFCELSSKIIVRDVVKQSEKNKQDFSTNFLELTSREKEVLKLVVDGLNGPGISKKLSLSRRTVENHRANIMKKLHVKNTGELIKLAGEHRLFL